MVFIGNFDNLSFAKIKIFQNQYDIKCVLNDKNIEITDWKLIANEFNCYFKNVGKKKLKLFFNFYNTMHALVCCKTIVKMSFDQWIKTKQIHNPIYLV